MHFTREPAPFLIPPALRTHLSSYLLEHGTGGGIGDYLPGDPVWSLSTDAGDVVGYAWLTQHDGPHTPRGHHMNLAVFAQAQGSGAGSFALARLEEYAFANELNELLCQVNSNRPETGAWVRQWLLRKGYEVVRPESERFDRYAAMSDAEYAAMYPCTVYLRKRIANRGA